MAMEGFETSSPVLFRGDEVPKSSVILNRILPVLGEVAQIGLALGGPQDSVFVNGSNSSIYRLYIIITSIHQ